MQHLTIRNVPADVARALDREKERRRTSTNQLVIELLAGALGIGGKPRDNGLAAFAGTWSDADLREFEAATTGLRQVDDEVWK